VRKTNSGTDVVYQYDLSGQLIAETSSTGTVQKEYVWLGDRLIAIGQGTSLFYADTDHLGTPRGVVNAAGTEVWRMTPVTEPFGNVQPNQDPGNTGTSFVLNLRFPGQYYDQETGLAQNWFRDYNSATGRYVESDPIGLGGGMNTYSYVGGSPLMYIDPYGLNGNAANRRSSQRNTPPKPNLPSSPSNSLWNNISDWLTGGPANPFADMVCLEAVCTEHSECKVKDYTVVVTAWLPSNPGVLELRKNCVCTKMRLRGDYDPTGAPPNPFRHQYK